jgi:hypothetical protein
MSESSVKVAVRVRPFNQREHQEGAELCISMSGQSTTIFNNSTNFSRKFIFDYSYWSHDGFREEEETGFFKKSSPSSTYADQNRVFEDIGKGVLNNAWEGYHCCLFAYGQTGSGKSYSMVGYRGNKGIIPITCEEIFQQIEERTDPHIEYIVNASMLEIYNEQVHDLLVHPSNRVQGGLKVRQDKTQGVFVENLTKENCQSYEEINRVLELGNKHRTVAATNMNATSSRAHTILTISFTQIFYEQSTGKPLNRKQSNINLVDLAGSERAGKTGATGERLQEGSSINKSLSTLGKVITTLAKKSAGLLGKNEVIPYRESKLTRILQNALGGNSKTTMIAAISPALFNFEESLSTLRYADAVKSIKNQAIVNETAQEKLIRELKEENEKLKAMLENKLSRPNDSMTEEARLAYEREIEALRKAKEETDSNWQQKLRSHGVRMTVLPMIVENIKRPTGPFISNLNEDPLLSGYLKYSFKAGVNRIGKKNPNSQPDMAIDGLGIGQDHCIVRLENENCLLIPSTDSNLKTMRNGKIIDQPVLLENQDRLRFGNHNYFLFIDPDELSNKTFDWEFAVKEANSEQVKGILGEKNEELVRKEQEIKAKFQAEWEEARAKMEEEKMQIQKLLNEKGSAAALMQEREKELMKKHQEIEKDILNKQKMLEQYEDNRLALKRLTEILSKAVSEINEANERAVLLGKNVFFQPELYREGAKPGLASTNVRVKLIYPDIEEDFPITWAVDKLEERLVDMREVCNQLAYGVNPEDIDLGYDPFYDQIDQSQRTYQLIGNAYVFLEVLFYYMTVDEDAFPIIDDHGQHQGFLKVSISPEVENLKDEPESLRDLLSRSIDFHLSIKDAQGIPANYSTNVYCEYNLLNSGVCRTLACLDQSTSPAFHYKMTHNFLISESLIDKILTNMLVISVFGDISEDRKMRGIDQLKSRAKNRGESLKAMRSFTQMEAAEEMLSGYDLRMNSVGGNKSIIERSHGLLNYTIHNELRSGNQSIAAGLSLNQSVLNQSEVPEGDLKAIVKSQKEEIRRLKLEHAKLENQLIIDSNLNRNQKVETVREKSCACVII